MRLRTNQQRHHYEDDSDPAVVNDIRNRNYEYTDNSGSYEYNPENDLHTNGNSKTKFFTVIFIMFAFIFLTLFNFNSFLVLRGILYGIPRSAEQKTQYSHHARP